MLDGLTQKIALLKTSAIYNKIRLKKTEINVIAFFISTEKGYFRD